MGLCVPCICVLLFRYFQFQCFFSIIRAPTTPRSDFSDGTVDIRDANIVLETLLFHSVRWMLTRRVRIRILVDRTKGPTARLRSNVIFIRPSSRRKKRISLDGSRIVRENGSKTWRLERKFTFHSSRHMPLGVARCPVAHSAEREAHCLVEMFHKERVLHDQ